MTVYTKTWKKKKAAVKSSEHVYNSLSSTQKKQISQAKSYKATVTAAQSSIDAINDSLTYYYKNEKTKAKGKDGKTKTKKVKVKRKTPAKPSKVQQKQLNDYKSQITSANKKLNSLTSSSSYKKSSSKLKKAKESKKDATAKYNAYMAKRHKTALSRIAKQRQENKNRFMAPHASLHATNSLTGLEVFLFATDESETNDSNANTYSIDKDDPVVDHVQRSAKTITVNGYLYDQKAGKRLWPGAENDVSGAGLPKKSCRQQYNNLKKWQFDGTELVYKSNAANDIGGHVMNKIYYKHLFMTNLTKTLDAPLLGMMKISMTFQFAYKAKVTTTSKGTKNNKGKKTTGGSYIGAKYITVKKGMTYWGLAKKYGTTVVQLRKWNGSEKVTMYPGKNGKYPVKLRVTQGMSTTAMSNSLIKNKASIKANSTLNKIAKQLSK
ncbi:LysM peptidoglycan-binding domain-containing protein [Levilactobacillus enshiensis]|uniref:LysM peptidoglycan-binding domain-containing protein n=1 Tax=Levilactobacillus enshiensis TaxID=2590213 RepID=UPI001179C3EF|nr:LysM domain-containing protein [Levilactobacillus enshiensis]